MLKELEDYDWFPAQLRRWQMEYIGNVVTWFQLYKPLKPVLLHMISENKIDVLQDICSGSGIPAINMHDLLGGSFKTILSDKYPDRSFKVSGNVCYLEKKEDVLLLKPSPGICYTMYNGFHHFSSVDQINLVKKMVSYKNLFLFAEIVQPGFFTLIKVIFTTTLMQLFTAPFIKPFSMKRMFFTYILPVNLFTILIDGIISVLRSKSAGRYRELFTGLTTNDFEVTVDRFTNWKGSVIYIKGNSLK